MAELKSMTAVKALDELRESLAKHRDSAIGNIDMLSVDDHTFNAISSLISGYTIAIMKVYSIARILKKEG
jgi:hypothetical protein